MAMDLMCSGSIGDTYRLADQLLGCYGETLGYHQNAYKIEKQVPCRSQCSAISAELSPAHFDGSTGSDTADLQQALQSLSHGGPQVVLTELRPNSRSIQQQDWNTWNMDSARFQYVLMSPTSPGTKLGDETLSCLNQGQSYEIKLKKLHEIGFASCQNTVKSIIRIIFHDRRLQYTEMEQLKNWQHTRSGDRFIDIDVPLSYGLIDVNHDSLNSAEITWDSRQEASVFVRVNCISTEFTVRKRGGEKGIPFRIQIETYPLMPGGAMDEKMEQPIHCASCKIKVFKPKGAERKNKTDLEKFYKASEAERAIFRPMMEVTIFAEMSIAHVANYLEQRRRHEHEFDELQYKVALQAQLGVAGQPLLGSSHSLPSNGSSYGESPVDRMLMRADSHQDVRKMESGCLQRQSSNSTMSLSPPYNNPRQQFIPSPSVPLINNSPVSQPSIPQLVGESTPQQVMYWLHLHRFDNVAHNFHDYSGADMLKLSRSDFIQLCGIADGIRLNNAVHGRVLRPRRTIYLCVDSRDSNSGDQLKFAACSSFPAQQQPTSQHQQQQNRFRKCGSDSSFDISLASPLSASSNGSTGTSPAGSTGDINSLSPYGCNFWPVFQDYSPSPPPHHISPPQQQQQQLAMAGSVYPSSADAAAALAPAAVEGSQSMWKPMGKRRSDDVEDDVVDASNAANATSSSPKRGRYASADVTSRRMYQAVYLEMLTVGHLRDRLALTFGLTFQQIVGIYLCTAGGINVAVSDSVVQNMSDGARFLVNFSHYNDHLTPCTVLLKAIDA